jgi:hypothetical protein
MADRGPSRSWPRQAVDVGNYRGPAGAGVDQEWEVGGRSLALRSSMRRLLRDGEQVMGGLGERLDAAVLQSSPQRSGGASLMWM